MQGELELSWVANTVGPLTIREDSEDESRTPVKSDPDADIDGATARKYLMLDDVKPSDMDYDVADEEDWNPAK